MCHSCDFQVFKISRIVFYMKKLHYICDKTAFKRNNKQQCVKTLNDNDQRKDVSYLINDLSSLINITENKPYHLVFVRLVVYITLLIKFTFTN